MTPLTATLLSALCSLLSALSLRLEGTEDKFRNRESRPEDLQIIAELKDMVTERESLVKKLVVSALLCSHHLTPSATVLLALLISILISIHTRLYSV